VVNGEGRQGVFIGSGDGTVTGKQIQGTVRWSLWTGNCVYPAIRKGQAIPEGLHLCTMDPGGLIQTSDGGRIRFDGRGYGLRAPDKYRTRPNLTPYLTTVVRLLAVKDRTKSFKR